MINNILDLHIDILQPLRNISNDGGSTIFVVLFWYLIMALLQYMWYRVYRYSIMCKPLFVGIQNLLSKVEYIASEFAHA